MKKSNAITIGLLWLLLLFAFLTPQVIGINAASNENSISFEKVPLTNSEINAAFPNLPTAEDLWNSDVKFWIDTRDMGKQVIDPSLPYAPYMKEARILYEPIMNYTSDTPNYLNGGVIRNVPIIWLQYNSTIWVQVPIDTLKVTTHPDSLEQQTLSSVAAQPTQQNTWALGLYANPAQIAGSTPVYGALSIGSWGSYTPSHPSYYLGCDVLTVTDWVLIFQVVMERTQAGYSLHVQVWNMYGRIVHEYVRYFTDIVLGQLYHEYIRYNPNYTGWEFYWNFILLGPRLYDGEWHIVTGNQPNVVVESNDFTAGDFIHYNTIIGDIVGGNYWGAILYLFGGDWKPWELSDPLPNAYAYHGGSTTHVIFSVGTAGPPSWFGEMGYLYYSGTRPDPEQIVVGYGLPQPSHGRRLW